MLGRASVPAPFSRPARPSSTSRPRRQGPEGPHSSSVALDLATPAFDGDAGELLGLGRVVAYGGNGRVGVLVPQGSGEAKQVAVVELAAPVDLVPGFAPDPGGAQPLVGVGELGRPRGGDEHLVEP